MVVCKQMIIIEIKIITWNNVKISIRYEWFKPFNRVEISCIK